MGWRERVDLPEWGVTRIKAKIDTGARTSAIHVSTLSELEDGQVRFEVVLREGFSRKTTWVTAKPVRRTMIKSSSGHRQERLVFCTKMKIGEIEREVELTLVSRKGMLCRMLVGRTALAGVLVDPRRIYLATRAPGKALKPKKTGKKRK
ncbi:ATP-dependent zinc protease [bacterium]|nr:ATP-dependent zinc protease [bacterium]